MGCASERVELVVESTNVLTLRRLRNVVTGDLIVGGIGSGVSVTASVHSAGGVLITGSGSPITLDYVTGTPGMFRGRVLSTAAYAVGATGYIRVTITISGGPVRVMYVDYVVIKG